jgi:hypothetical protein
VLYYCCYISVGRQNRQPDDSGLGSDDQRSALVVRTVRARAELVRVPSFLRDLLAKTADLARGMDCNGSRPLLYIYIEDYD